MCKFNIILVILSVILSQVLSNPMTDCISKLNSETLCFSYGCKEGCNRRYSCEDYCAGLSSYKNPVIMDDCINLTVPSLGTMKSVCKCKYANNAFNMRQGPGGLAGIACKTMYLGQLVGGVFKTVAVP